MNIIIEINGVNIIYMYKTVPLGVFYSTKVLITFATNNSRKIHE